MKEQENVCLTFDAACDAAIEMETLIYQNFLKAIRLVKDKAGREILQEAATVRLEIKLKLEKAALQGRLDPQEVKGAVPTMDLAHSIRCCDLRQITADADNRKALAFAMQMSKDALEFYRRMTAQCSGAPMADLFKALGDDQTRYLHELEDTYEKHFLTEG